MVALSKVISTIKLKLIALIMSVSTFAVILTASALMYSSYSENLRNNLKELQTLASLIGDRSSAALIFNDSKLAEDNLRSLRIRSSILAACIFSGDDQLFASYGNTDDVKETCLKHKDLKGHRYIENQLIISNDILSGTENIGTVIFNTSLEGIRDEFKQQLLRTVGVIVLIVIFSLFLSLWLQRLISRPVTHLMDVSNEVMKEHDYSIRATKFSDDELGKLTGAINSMLSTMEEQNLRLLGRSAILEKEVEERTRKLASSEARHRITLETMGDGLVTIDDDGLMLSFNRAAENMFGCKEPDVIGKNINLLIAESDTEQYEKDFQNYKVADEKKNTGSAVEYEAQKKDGSSFPAELFISKMMIDGERVFSGIIRDITERKRIDKMKNEFISTVSHELRTPLTSIRGSLGLLNGGAMGEFQPKAKKMLNIASNNTERLLFLINDILDIQKIESGQVTFSFETLEVMSFLEQAVVEHGGYGKQHGVRFEVTHAIEHAHVYADKDRLMQVMSNLMSNAAKFSPEGSIVEISTVRRSNGRIRISVTDFGSGVPVEFQDKLFDRFTQSDSSDTRAKGGTGLGMAITKAVVEKHGGLIDFITQEGIGSTFYIELSEVKMDLEQGESPLSLDGDNDVSQVLIVEDDLDIAALIRRMLAEAGYNADIATSAEEARQKIKLGNYELMTLDIALPDEDGVSLFRSLRSDAETQDLPVVVLSAQADEAKRNLNGGAVGVLDWLSKPIDQNRLIDLVKQTVSRKDVPRILHVEDDEDLQNVIGGMLQGQCDLVTTTTVAASREALKTGEFDLVLLDIGLPDGSGLDLLDAIEHHVSPPQVVIFSAQDVNREDAARVDQVLVKSKTSNDDLLLVIKEILNAGHNVQD